MERWDGKGPLGRAKGEQIPLPMRIVHVAKDAAFQRLLGGSEYAVRVVGERAGHAFDPDVAACLVDEATEVLAFEESASAWVDALAGAAATARVGCGGRRSRACAMGSFADLASPYLSGHSIGVGMLARSAAEACGIDALGMIAIHRAGLLHDWAG